MKRLAITLALTLFLPITAQAQTGFILGYAIGSMNSSNDQTEAQPAAAPNVIYQANPDVMKKVNPLTMRTAAAEACFSGGRYLHDRTGQQVWQLFVSVVKNPEAYVILQVVRVVRPEPCAVFWFTYVDKEIK